eukprot:5784069-Prymnesium_polylepis.2
MLAITEFVRLPCGSGPGSFCPFGSASASSCPPGTYSSAMELESSEGCISCPVGHLCAVGVGAPTPCYSGFVAPEPSSAECSECPAGHHQEQIGQTACSACSVGKFQPRSGSAECSVCDV